MSRTGVRPLRTRWALRPALRPKGDTHLTHTLHTHDGEGQAVLRRARKGRDTTMQRVGKRPHVELVLPPTWFHMDMHSDACHGKFITYMINVRKGVI